MKTPNEIVAHAVKYNDNAWKDYTISELGQWVHLLAKRATHRKDAVKRAKDLEDARNYFRMIEAHLDSLES